MSAQVNRPQVNQQQVNQPQVNLQPQAGPVADPANQPQVNLQQGGQGPQPGQQPVVPGPQPVVNAVPQPAGGQAPLNQADHAPEPDPHAGRSEQLHRPPEPQISAILLTSYAKYDIFSIERGALQRAERKRGFDLT